MTPCYSYSAAVIKDSRDTNATACDNAVCTWTNNGYRLPSEGEWQFAASNKGATPYNYASGATADYTNSTESQKVAWYSVNSGGTTKNVGTTVNPSALTLWDMSGNVREFCWDWLGTYPTASQSDYRGAASGSFRIWRGGMWKSEIPAGIGLQVGYRNGYGPYSESNIVGFRVARSN
ncbi:MAG: SUMF1/EgtB/PvdO family nonheme iron enzyme [Spirochaetes bacterium]|nr:SUMF1/EgtB/PvdO family nonheme iron enzyme [Spirochaetota bacterium]